MALQLQRGSTNTGKAGWLKLTAGLCLQVHAAGKAIAGKRSIGRDHVVWISDRDTIYIAHCIVCCQY